ncbi:MAG: CAP domain-containing protein [Pseudolabrys sp.]
MRPINAAILLITLTASAHAVEQNVGASPDNALAVPIPPAVTSTIVPTDTAPIEAPPLPRPKPYVTGDNPAALISAFRRQHGEGSVTIDGALTRIAQEQANAMAVRDSLDHNALAPFSSRMSRSRFNRAAENIAYGHADFASTLKQWTNSAGHRANLLLHGAKWIGVAHAQSGRRMYWAMVIGGEMKDHAVYSNIRR